MNVTWNRINVTLVPEGIFSDKTRRLSSLSLAACVLYFSVVYVMLRLLYLCAMGTRSISPHDHE
jgi:hypothetical protein